MKELTCDKFKSRCKLKKLPREKAIVEHLHLVLMDCYVCHCVGGEIESLELIIFIHILLNSWWRVLCSFAHWYYYFFLFAGT